MQWQEWSGYTFLHHYIFNQYSNDLLYTSGRSRDRGGHCSSPSPTTPPNKKIQVFVEKKKHTQLSENHIIFLKYV